MQKSSDIWPPVILPAALRTPVSLRNRLVKLTFITQEIRDGIAAITPLRRLGEPEDIAAAAVLFCCDDAPCFEKHAITSLIPTPTSTARHGGAPTTSILGERAAQGFSSKLLKSCWGG
jgi:NAD(P)-dependent dehydrogenase (short-subunit alcohol dehydrogenase family)